MTIVSAGSASRSGSYAPNRLKAPVTLEPDRFDRQKSRLIDKGRSCHNPSGSYEGSQDQTYWYVTRFLFSFSIVPDVTNTRQWTITRIRNQRELIADRKSQVMVALARTTPSKSKEDQQKLEEQHKARVKAEIDAEDRKRVERMTRRLYGEPPAYKDSNGRLSNSDGKESKSAECKNG